MLLVVVFRWRVSIVALILVRMTILGGVLLFLVAFARLVAAAMTASLGVTVGFVIYLCLKSIALETLGARNSFTHRL